MKKQTITADQYLDELDRAVNAKPPAGAFSVDDAMARTGMSRPGAHARLSGDARLQSGRFMRRGRWIMYYWPKQQEGER